VKKGERTSGPYKVRLNEHTSTVLCGEGGSGSELAYTQQITTTERDRTQTSANGEVVGGRGGGGAGVLVRWRAGGRAGEEI